MTNGFLIRICVCSVFLLAGPVSAANGTDPWEPMNRTIMGFNDAADGAILKPIARGYTAVFPKPVRTGVTNFFANLREPWISLNQLLQGKPREFASDLGRFGVNTTLGLVGLFDVASGMGLEKHNEDFGQTLGVWGIGPGPYLVVPLWGPSSVRDGVGDIAGIWGFLPFYLDNTTARDILSALWIVKTRADYLEAEKLVQGDRYLFIRDAYLQNREYNVRDGLLDDPFLSDEF